MTEGSATPPAGCGATSTDRFCVTCGTPLTEGVRFCPQLGTPLGASGATQPAIPGMAPMPVAAGSQIPWLIAIGLSVVAAAGVIYAAIGRDGLPAGGGAPAAQAAPAGGGLGPAPDISGLTPREQFARLNDRVMAAAEAGDTSTVINFWPMAYGAYEQLVPGDRDIDARYHMATLYLVVGQFPEVLALTDTIMTEAPDNLMAWYLRALVYEYQEDGAKTREARDNFNRLYPTQIEQPRGEYIDHRDMLDAFRARPGVN